jgi:IS605 OrfB family transposase
MSKQQVYGTTQVALKVQDLLVSYFVHQCRHSNSLFNSAVFWVRQKHFDTCPRTEYFDNEGIYRSGFKTKACYASYAELCRVFKDNPHYKALGGQCAQQTLKSVSEAFTSYSNLLSLWFEGEIEDKPKMPDYRTPGGLYVVSYPAQAIQLDLESGECRLPLSQELNADFKELAGTTEILINGCKGISLDSLVEVRILPRNRQFYAEFVYKKPVRQANVNPVKFLSLDPGLNNWVTGVSNACHSFIVDGKRLKSLNQWYNKQISVLKEGKPQGFWDDTLAAITEKRNRQMRDAVNKTARFIINRCLQNDIQHIIFGWNKGIKDSINIGRANNQQFVCIPTAKLRARLSQLCEEYGLVYTETEEANTSIASFLDADSLPKHGEKPKNWKASGKRIKRGLYCSSKGFIINADCNGSGNISRKVASILGINPEEISRASLTAPKRYDIFNCMKKLYRSKCEARSFQCLA